MAGFNQSAEGDLKIKKKQIVLKKRIYKKKNMAHECHF